jgi:hypothetical protein
MMIISGFREEKLCASCEFNFCAVMCLCGDMLLLA